MQLPFISYVLQLNGWQRVLPFRAGYFDFSKLICGQQENSTHTVGCRLHSNDELQNQRVIFIASVHPINRYMNNSEQAVYY